MEIFEEKCIKYKIRTISEIKVIIINLIIYTNWDFKTMVLTNLTSNYINKNKFKIKKIRK